MLTNNFYKIVMNKIRKCEGTADSVNGYTVPLATSDIDTAQFGDLSADGHPGTGDYQNGYTYMVLGSGSTPPKRTDTKVETLVYSYTTVSVGQNVSDKLVYTKVIRNDTENPITISEVCLYVGKMLVGTATYGFLVSRDVLDEPIILQPGEYTNITVDLLNM